uniref:Uncharacterized protein n=1 Tax=Sphaerodactylus townsendi TaxID=933632 RepID=A0ACB8F0S9_9SAUR
MQSQVSKLGNLGIAIFTQNATGHIEGESSGTQKTTNEAVAALTADRNREGPLRSESTMADYVTDDLTVASNSPTQRVTIPMPHHQVDLTATRRPHRSFQVTFGGDPDELAFFLIQVGFYMEVHGAGFRMDRERVFELGTQLRGEAVNWLVGLVETNAAELYDLEQFLLALRLRFEDPLTEEKAQASLQRLQQGTRSISDFAAEVRRLASRLRGWPELVLVQLFKDALSTEIQEH